MCQVTCGTFFSVTL